MKPLSRSSAGTGAKKGGGQSLADSYLIASADGKLQLVGKAGRLEKPVDAHRGACLSAR